MKETALDKKKWEQWITKNTPELKKRSKYIFEKMKKSNLALSGMYSSLFDEDDVYQEMVAFLWENQEKTEELFSAHGKLNKRFINFLIDKSRTKENQDIYKDKWRMFRRHILDVLSKCHGFVKTNTKTQGKRFSLSNEAPKIVWSVEDLIGIPYPADMPLNYDQINTAVNIEKLARHFWEHGIEITKDPNISIGVNDFMHWISKYVPIQPRVVYDSEFSSDSSESDYSYMENYSKEYPMIEEMAANRLTVFVDTFFNRLDEKEKHIFCYFECKELPHKKVSELMNKKANMSYQREHVREKLKTFLRPLDLLSPGEDENALAFDFFKKQLCEKLTGFVD